MEVTYWVDAIYSGGDSFWIHEDKDPIYIARVGDTIWIHSDINYPCHDFVVRQVFYSPGGKPSVEIYCAPASLLYRCLIFTRHISKYHIRRFFKQPIWTFKRFWKHFVIETDY